uniref:uncharacterized protein LOC122594684 n=1 Tax=Erigeron canadensis TaxID=72917 RepID=UPI001CB92AEA|nr:uncharacterized protein LOC122594684 [Erigeron canadensis]
MQDLSKRTSLLANNNKPPNVKKTTAKKKFVSEDEDFGPWYTQPSKKLSIIGKKSFKKALRRKRYQSGGPRVHYLTTAGHTLPIDLTKAMEQAGVLIKKVNAGSDDYESMILS